MNPNSYNLNLSEKNAIFSIAAIFALRMLGLFMIVPLFSLYAPDLRDATPFLIGMALGCYGFSQALLQMPFGWWSDYWGRKPVIAIGLGIFIVGSIIAALSHSIWTVMLGRTLQGAGAVGSAAQALLADLTRPEQRTKAMAVIGITIGISFILAMIIGPILSTWFNMAGLFWLSSALGLFAIIILFFTVPSSVQQNSIAAKPHFSEILMTLQRRDLLQFNMGILFLHAILTANFLALPQLLQTTGLNAQHQWHMYLPVLLLALITIMPFLRRSSQKDNTHELTVWAIAALSLSQLLLVFFHGSILSLGFSLWLFFSAFTLLEAMLPSAVSNLAPITHKGAVMGFFSTCQFSGIFLGGLIGGWLYSQFQIKGIFCWGILLCLLWIYMTNNKLPFLLRKLAGLGR